MEQMIGSEYEQIPCFVKELDDLQMFEMAVAENIKRRNLNPVETATAMQTYQEKFGKTSAETGEFFGVDEATVRGTVRLLKLPEVARAKLSAGEITMGAARQLLVLVRVAPDSIENAVERIIEGDQPEKVIEGVLDDLAYHNRAIKMWASWHSGKPAAGSGLWELTEPSKNFAKYMPDVAGLEGLDKRLAKKLIESDGLVAHKQDLENWARKLQSGLVAAGALIAQGAPADTIERLDQLVHPPACTACPFYVKANNNHYCTWKVCHTRKKEAWSFLELDKSEKKLEIRGLSADEARGGFVVLGNNYNSEQQRQEEALIAAKDPNLRLHIKPGQYEHRYTKSEIVEVVSIAPKAVEEQKAEKQKAKEEESNQEREKHWKNERSLRDASEKFEETEVQLVCAHLLDGLDNLGFLMAMADITDLDFEPDQGEKAPSRKEKLERCREEIISHVIGEASSYDKRAKGPVAIAEHWQGVATTWGVDLPADWLEKAASYWPKDVEPPTEAEKEETEENAEEEDE
jgi:ParB-like chromosome segregation protein Spo0J